jgi:hypothetical protein
LRRCRPGQRDETQHYRYISLRHEPVLTPSDYFSARLPFPSLVCPQSESRRFAVSYCQLIGMCLPVKPFIINLMGP